MNDTRSGGPSAAAGLVFALLQLAYIAFSLGVQPDTPIGEVASLYAQNRTSALLWNFVGALSFFFFLFFLGALWSALRRAEGDTGFLAMVALGAGLVVVAVHSLETVSAYTLAWHVAGEGNLAAVRVLFDLQNLVVYYYSIPLAAMLLATSIATLRTRVLPVWTAWVGIANGVLWLVAAVGVVDPQHGPLVVVALVALALLLLLWTPAVSIALMRRAGSAR